MNLITLIILQNVQDVTLQKYVSSLEQDFKYYYFWLEKESYEVLVKI